MLDILIILATLVGLVVGGHHFVLGASAIGHRFGMTPVFIGATIVAIGTSLPEWAVSVFAAIGGSSGISIGNVVGSNICNIGIVLGLAAVVAPLRTTRAIVLRDGLIMLGATVLMLVVTADGQISRADGVMLLMAGGVAIAVYAYTGRSDQDVDVTFRWWEVPRTIAALALVLVSSDYFIHSAQNVSQSFGISPWVIGITIAAIGTSLPELVTSLAAAAQGQSDIILGNLLGSCTMNILWVLGCAGTIQPMQSGPFSALDGALFAGLMVVAITFLFTQLVVTRWEGAVLLACGLGWYAAQAWL